MNARKLLSHHKVEVRQLEEGLKGSWHSGVVVGVSDVCRDVKYDELLCESGKSKLVESIPVTGAIEGLYQRPCVKFNHRGRIRPIPPLQQPLTVEAKLSFGMCVDVLFKEAWWEGVIVDCDETAKERRVYFPDEGDECVFKLTDMRVTSEWDEFSGQWRERGVWVLVNLAKEHKKDGNLFQLIRRVWKRLKAHYGFQKMISEWTCGAYCVWKEYFRDVIHGMNAKTGGKGISSPNAFQRHAVRKMKRRSKMSQSSFLDASVVTRSMHKRKEKHVSLAVRTRRMCLSDVEDSLALPANRNGYLTDGHCMRRKLAIVDECVNTDVPEHCENGEFGQSQYHGPTSSRVVDEWCDHAGMPKNNRVSSRNPHTSDTSLKISQKNRLRMKKWKLGEDTLTPRKRISARIPDQKLEGNPNCISSKARKVHGRVSFQFEDNNSFHRRRELMLINQKKVGIVERFPSHIKGRRTRICRRNIVKKRSPRRIKKIHPRKTPVTSTNSVPTLQKEVETSKLEEDEGSQNEGAQHVLASCQEPGPQDSLDDPDKQKVKRGRFHDSVCLVCQYGGELLHCDLCLSSYHSTCVDLEDVPAGESFCPSCKCGICGLEHSVNDDQLFTQACYQCSRRYHRACLNEAGTSVSEDSFLDNFCSRRCFEICARLHELLQISNPTAMKGLTWTITRSRRNDCNVHNERVHPLIQVSQVLNVFHECFEPITEPHTGRDLVADIVYNNGSKLRRLDFHGFYVITLVDGEELVCVATIRIHGQKVAEMPLIATRFKYRRKGMCRLLLDELEKMLVEMGVERLVLPGIAQLSDTWVSSFGFAEMPASLRKELLGYPFVLFQGTSLFQKILRRSGTSDPLRAASNVERNGLASPQENNSVGDPNLKFILHYNRRRKSEDSSKQKPKGEMDGPNKNQSAYKCVYKRRRIQASRDLLHSQKPTAVTLAVNVH